ncbi:hypothetical protein BGZ49_003772, partial [Haplosporangium sp. Z 27]
PGNSRDVEELTETIKGFEAVQDRAHTRARPRSKFSLCLDNEATTTQSYGHFSHHFPRCAGSPSPMPASSVSPTMADMNPIANSTEAPGGYMQDTEHTALDDMESEYQARTKYSFPTSNTTTIPQ